MYTDFLLPLSKYANGDAVYTTMLSYKVKKRDNKLEVGAGHDSVQDCVVKPLVAYSIPFFYWINVYIFMKLLGDSDQFCFQIN